MTEPQDKSGFGGLRILVVVPCLNEGRKIAAVVADLRRHAPYADVLVVDDGSSDDTAERAVQAEAAVARLPFNLGVGGAMQTGYQYAAGRGYDVAVQFDGDGQHCADQLDGLIAPVARGEADLSVGSRLLGERSYHFSLARWVGSRILVGMTGLLTGLRVTDPTSGFRAASRRMIEFFSLHYPQTYLGDTVEALASAAWHGMTIREVPAKMRMTRTSSITNLRGMVHMLRISIALVIDRIEKRFPLPPGDSSPPEPSANSTPASPSNCKL